MTFNQSWNLFLNGGVVAAVTTMYDTYTGFWWQFILFIFLIFLSYMGTKSEAVAAIITVCGAIYLRTVIPVTAHAPLYLIAALLIGVLLWRAIGKGE